MAARIALIDDDSDFTSLVAELLQECSWEAVVCHEDGDALPCVRRERPDLIVLDVRMSTRESGWQVLEALRGDPGLRSIPIIVCTAALDDLQTHETWLQDQGVATLAKPFDVDDLLALIECMLARQSRNTTGTRAPRNGGSYQS